MKGVKAMGTVQSFFLFWDGPDWKSIEWNEIDMEIVPSITLNGFSRNLMFGNGAGKVED